MTYAELYMTIITNKHPAWSLICSTAGGQWPHNVSYGAASATRTVRPASGEAVRYGLVGIAMLPLGIWITSFDREEDQLLADAPVVSGVVVDEPVPLIERGRPLTVSFTTSRGERIEMTIVKYLVPHRTKGQSIDIQYAYDGDEVLAREAGWEPDFWSRYLHLCMGIAGAGVGTAVLFISSRRRGAADGK